MLMKGLLRATGTGDEYFTISSCSLTVFVDLNLQIFVGDIAFVN